ncbi:MAG: DUF2254 domain-containing protein [Chloroflexi bacterium]|nr:DUF2254 domain-containing protein [Chloroflexota bacterium]MBA4171043.1 DUF2254 domain-containing protein [Chloroflexota bacterium]
MTLKRLVIRVRSSLWFVPVLCVMAGAALSFATIVIDRAFEYEAIPSSIVGGPDAATAMLSTVAASMVSLTALVLTITMVVVQLAMGQFSPRIVQRILQDKPSQFAIGLFVATFVHAILTLREVTNNGDGTGQVPGVAILTAFVLVVVSIAVLVIYVHHIGEALRVSALIELVSKDTRKLIDRHYPDKGAAAQPDSGSPDLIMARESGVITVIGHENLVEEARRVGCVLELVPALGQFVPMGAPLFRVRGNQVGLDEDRLHQSVILKLERTLDQDVAYGVRLLVDIAERSLSESPFLDPTTAVQAIDRLHDILRQLVRRPFPDGRYRDAAGEIRLVVPFMSWDDYLHLAIDEIRLAGAASPQATRRLKAALLDLRSVAPADRVASIDGHLELLAADVKDKMAERDLDLALGSDHQGMGVSTEP